MSARAPEPAPGGGKFRPSLVASEHALARPAAQRALLRRLPLAHEFAQAIAAAGLPPLSATRPSVLQVNVGKLCNQSCRHCHVDAGPDRTEAMDEATLDACLVALERWRIPTLDVTGGAPELHPSLRRLVSGARARGAHVMLRCNLTSLELPSLAELPAFLAAERVEVVASLPHPSEALTDRQRGAGVFARSIQALRRLNALGYGDGRSGLRLTLVSNPVGAFMPGDQASLERECRAELGRTHGVVFDQLLCLANVPIGRYLAWLEESGNTERYVAGLVRAFNPANVAGLMCRTTLSVGPDGTIYDCDFDQMLEMPVNLPHTTIHAALAAPGDPFPERAVATDRHCFACTAGSGSSCGGALT